MNTNIVDYKKEFKKEFDSICYRNGLNRISAWGDLMGAFACTLSNSTEVNADRRAIREKEYETYVQQLGGNVTELSKLLSYVLLALSENPEQDFLGDLYMSLEFGNSHVGQFFTPYSVAVMSAEITVSDPTDEINNKGYFTVLDPTVGAGCMLLAAANVLKRKYAAAHKAIYVGQDLDVTAVHMAYIQLAATGHAAVIIHGNSLSEPYTGHPLVIEEGTNLWYTPALYNEFWTTLRYSFYMEHNKCNTPDATKDGTKEDVA